MLNGVHNVTRGNEHITSKTLIQQMTGGGGDTVERDSASDR